MDDKKTGLNIIISIVTILFIIGLLLFVFVLLGGEMQSATTKTASNSLVNETMTFVYNNNQGNTTSVASLEDIALSNVVVLTNFLMPSSTSDYYCNTQNCNLGSDADLNTRTNATTDPEFRYNYTFLDGFGSSGVNFTALFYSENSQSGATKISCINSTNDLQLLAFSENFTGTLNVNTTGQLDNTCLLANNKVALVYENDTISPSYNHSVIQSEERTNQLAGIELFTVNVTAGDFNMGKIATRLRASAGNEGCNATIYLKNKYGNETYRNCVATVHELATPKPWSECEFNLFNMTNNTEYQINVTNLDCSSIIFMYGFYTLKGYRFYNSTQIQRITNVAVYDTIFFDGGDVIFINESNYTNSDGYVIADNSSYYLNRLVDVSADYSYSVSSEAGRVAEDTSSSLSTTINWFPIIVIVSIMIVLILLTIIIISAMRGSGFMIKASA